MSLWLNGIRSPASFRLNSAMINATIFNHDDAITPLRLAHTQRVMDITTSPFILLNTSPSTTVVPHPSLGHVTLLVFEAVMEVICVSLPGYITARLGHFDADKQKFLAQLNVMIFTPCMIFTKLASQLNADKLAELGVIPVIFLIQTAVSYLCSRVISRCFRFDKRASNFVTAMGVFGNSNSLPISLVLSLSQTLAGLHWDRIPGDNDDEVAARGILYLMIFQQLGQIVRWSWGYHVLLAPAKKRHDPPQSIASSSAVNGDDDAFVVTVEEGRHRHEIIHDPAETQAFMASSDNSDHTIQDDDNDPFASPRLRSDQADDPDAYEPAGRTPVATMSRTSLNDLDDDSPSPAARKPDALSPRKPHGRSTAHLHEPSYPDPRIDGAIDPEHGGMLSFPRIRNTDDVEDPPPLASLATRTRHYLAHALDRTKVVVRQRAIDTFARMPRPLQACLLALRHVARRTLSLLHEFMNPPLWAMFFAILVASIPDLQRLFFEEGSFIKNSVTSAIKSSGGVAVPLILVILGANLARNTQPDAHKPDHTSPSDHPTRLLIASLLSRMVFPTLFMAPILALFAKYVPISILDDPIFVVVCFLLTGAPSALQLAQICQINGVYEGAMSKVLFQSYVVWILPSTLVLIMCALQVVAWAC